MKDLNEKKLGPEASEWRLRSFLMINKLSKIDDELLVSHFQRQMELYEKEKKKAERILQIQKLDIKKIK